VKRASSTCTTHTREKKRKSCGEKLLLVIAVDAFVDVEDGFST